MNDLDEDLRELLARKAEDVSPHRHVPAALLGRARRRIALNALGVCVTVVVLAAGAFAGLRAFGGPPIHQPVGTGTPPVSPTIPTTTVSACTAAGLRATASMQGAAGSREGTIALTNGSGEACTLDGTPTITLLDENLNPITSGIAFGRSSPGWEVDASPTPPGWPVVTLQPGAAASVRILWSNWCPDGRATPTWRIEVPGGGTVDVGGLDAAGPPPCNGPSQPSTIEVGPFEPGPGG
jgi:hypothetical protein